MKHLNIRMAYLAIMALSFLLCMPSCGHRHHRSSGGREGRITETYNYGRDGGQYSRGGGCSRSRDRERGSIQFFESNTVYQPIYFTQDIDVRQNITFQEALYSVDPKAWEVEQKYDVGGTKLIAEMSADAEGIYCSRDPNNEVNIHILSLDQLKLRIENSKSSIYQQIINQQVVINYSSVELLSGNSFVEIIENLIEAYLTGKIVVHLSISNTTNRTVRCEIKQGQMLEAVNENVQNLVVAENKIIALAANQQTTMDIRVYCAAHYRKDPTGSSVRFTPYFLKASSNVYESQSSVWNYIEKGY